MVLLPFLTCWDNNSTPAPARIRDGYEAGAKAGAKDVSNQIYFKGRYYIAPLYNYGGVTLYTPFSGYLYSVNKNVSLPPANNTTTPLQLTIQEWFSENFAGEGGGRNGAGGGCRSYPRTNVIIIKIIIKTVLYSCKWLGIQFDRWIEWCK